MSTDATPRIRLVGTVVAACKQQLDSAGGMVLDLDVVTRREVTIPEGRTVGREDHHWVQILGCRWDREDYPEVGDRLEVEAYLGFEAVGALGPTSTLALSPYQRELADESMPDESEAVLTGRVEAIVPPGTWIEDGLSEILQLRLVETSGAGGEPRLREEWPPVSVVVAEPGVAAEVSRVRIGEVVTVRGALIQRPSSEGRPWCHAVIASALA
ncbi:MAG TPA: hypothetical protein VF017_07140 [Thermoanaerobaculia bacterium]|nr:hypothetical protein [Thermoanaerobaculia bacterium]